MSGRLALLCTLMLGGRLVHADEAIPEAGSTDQRIRRPVAVIELSDHADGRALADQLTSTLNNSDELKPLDTEKFRIALRDRTVDDVGDRIDEVRKAKEMAENQVSDFSFPTARDTATSGLTILKNLGPTPQNVALYAQLTFALGAAQLGDRKAKEADLEFRLAHALDPAFKPDGVRYLPDFVQAYEAAIKVAQPASKITVSGTGRVFLDGRDTGEDVHDSRQTFEVKAGKHVVWLTAPDRVPQAGATVVTGGRKEEISITLAVVDDSKRVIARKLALKVAPDPAARAGAMQDLAALLEVKDAVLLTRVNDKIIVQTWIVEPVTKDRAPGFSALREYDLGKDKPTEVLAPLLKPKKVVPPTKKDDKGPGITRPIEHDDRRWWQKRKYQVAGGVGAFVIGAVIYGFSTWDRSFQSARDSGVFGVRR